MDQKQEEEEEVEEVKDEVFENITSKARPPKLSRMRSLKRNCHITSYIKCRPGNVVCFGCSKSPCQIQSRPHLRPSFEGYFASQTGTIALQPGKSMLKSTSDKIGEIQKHLERMVSILREIDALRMAVRIESKVPLKKRYLTVVSSDKDHSAIIGIDWCHGQGPTIGLVLPIHSSTVCTLDGDGGFHVSRTSTINHIFRPVSVQTLWSARHVIEKAISFASKHRYFEGVDTKGFLEYYLNIVNSDFESISEWNELVDCNSCVMEKVNLTADPDPEKESMKNLIRVKLREIMRHLDMDVVSIKTVRDLCEKEIGKPLAEFKMFISDEILLVMGQMDSASEILDYLYLGSEWNATDLAGLKELGVGYILNLTREVDNLFPQNMIYYNIRVMDFESTELLRHWDHTYSFIERAREAGSKVLVHCRYGISRSASTVIAYIMKKKGWPMAYTLDYVVERRDIVQPNPGFTNQLIIYEGILNSSRNRFSSLFHQRSQALKSNDDIETAANKRLKFSKVHVENNTDDVDGTEEVAASCEAVDEMAEEEEKGEDVNPAEVPTEDSLDTKDSYPNESLVTHLNDSMNESAESDAGSESSANKIWESSGSSKKLRRAMTISSAGAVFIDNEEGASNETTSLHSDSGTERGSDKELNNANEDAVMKQVMMATIRKNELMMSVKKLNDESDSQMDCVEHDNDDWESNIKPSMLRRLSRASQVAHFANIANMNKRRSRSDSDSLRESVLMECDPELENPDDTDKPKVPNKVGLLSEVFTRRSKKHIRDYARRRTMDDDAFKFNSNKLSDVKLRIGIKDDSVTSITEVPENPIKLELAPKVEKVLPEKKPQFPRYRLYGRFNESAILWKSLECDSETIADTENDTFFSSVAALNHEIEELNRSCDADKSDNDKNDGDNKKDIGEDEDDEFSVADLVHLHDKIIREKSLQKKIGGRSVSDSDDTLKERVVGLQRVQSFPKTKRAEILKPKLNSKRHTPKRIADVKNIAGTFEKKSGDRQFEIVKDEETKQRSSSLGTTTNLKPNSVEIKERASTDVDLRSVDQTKSP